MGKMFGIIAMRFCSNDFARRLLSWYDRHRRPLPWRMEPSPYHVLVSEFMLQQTQVATVIAYYDRFISRFPTLGELAAADEVEVLRLWQGLGYYSRARNLHRAAQQIITNHGGQIPSDPAALRELPGIGRYTAGAIASIAFDRRAAILDGNVARVLCRVAKIGSDPRKPAIVRQLWEMAEQILPWRRTGDFNSALMELGATVCTPHSPDCRACPVKFACAAHAAGIQNEIPLARRRRRTPLHRRWTFILHHDGKYLIEQRPSTGRWASLWQFPTIEAADGAPSAAMVRRRLGISIGALRPIAEIAHTLTHRRYEFAAFAAVAKAAGDVAERRWVTLNQLDQYPLPRPHVALAGIISQTLPSSAPCDSQANESGHRSPLSQSSRRRRGHRR